MVNIAIFSVSGSLSRIFNMKSQPIGACEHSFARATKMPSSE